MSILVVIIIISFLILIHEGGHFIAAKKNKISVNEFGIGYPPRLIKLFTWKGTEFSLNLIPFGGYVSLEGEHGPDEQESAETKKKHTKKNKGEGPFYTKSAQARMIVILAGVAVNIIFSILAFAIVFSFMGIPTSLENQPRLGIIMEDTPAAAAGLKENTNIVSLKTDTKTYEIFTIEEVQEAVSEHKGETVTLETTKECDQMACPEETEIFELYIRTSEETPEGEGSIGIVFQDAIFIHYPWYEMPIRGTIYGIKQAFQLGWMIITSLGKMLGQLVTSGRVEEEVAGPVGLVHEAQKGNLFDDNFLSYLGFAGMLSLNLGIMNLLPIPALDGGRAIFIFLEKFIEKKKIQKIESYASYVGFILLIVLLIAVTVKDVVKIVAT